jgi:hypothetical protein
MLFLYFNMNTVELEKLRYPIGPFECPEEITNELLNQWITVLEQFPNRLRKLTENLSDLQLDIPYRPEGWTVRQVIHHLSDSHHHSYIRFKWALTEDQPVIKYYYEQLWAELPDAKSAPIEMSLKHLEAVHYKLVYLLKGMSDEDFNKSFIHPEHNEEVVLRKNVGVYAWHCNHHYAHIEQLLLREGWL